MVFTAIPLDISVKNERRRRVQQALDAQMIGRILQDEFRAEALFEQGQHALGKLLCILRLFRQPGVFLQIQKQQLAGRGHVFRVVQQTKHRLSPAVPALKQQRRDRAVPFGGKAVRNGCPRLGGTGQNLSQLLFQVLLVGHIGVRADFLYGGFQLLSAQIAILFQKIRNDIVKIHGFVRQDALAAFPLAD